MLAAPPLREPITDRRIGGSSEFIDLNGVGELLTLLLFFVFRDLGHQDRDESAWQASQRFTDALLDPTF